MQKEKFIRIRHFLGKSQSQLARLLCIAPKTVQSFEQGWRKISTQAERQLLFMLTLKKASDNSIKPCWEIMGCSDEWRRQCSAWELKAGHLCWYITGTYCQGECQDNWADKIEMCQECKVFNSLIPPPSP